jgi:ADP-ribose pyrophosphatase
METWIQRETVFEGGIFCVESGRVRLEDGTEARRDVVVHPGAVGIVPLMDDRVILVRQYRIAVGRMMIEIPAGKLESGDTPDRRAQTELAEEIGFVARTLVPAGRLFPSVGILTECIHLFLAFDLRPGSRDADGDERIEVVPMALDEVRRRLRAGEFEDAKTVVGLHALLGHLDGR